MTACTNGAWEHHSGTAFIDKSCPPNRSPFTEQVPRTYMSVERPLGDKRLGLWKQWGSNSATKKHTSKHALCKCSLKIEIVKNCDVWYANVQQFTKCVFFLDVLRYHLCFLLNWICNYFLPTILQQCGFCGFSFIAYISWNYKSRYSTWLW